MMMEARCSGRSMLELLRQWLMLVAQVLWLLADLIGQGQHWP
jgi:hypothetical protein